ncbi:hypothetical protein RI367_003599 [Sorochytrium milnesiophthora]
MALRHGAFKVHLHAATYGYPTAMRFRGSVVPRIWLPVSIMTLWSVAVYLINIYVCQSGKFCVSFPTIFLTISSLVLSLLLAFRTNTAYERFWEGRRLWSSLVISSRNLARVIWVGIDEPEPQDHIEKRAALKLLLAYFIAVKNYLRGDFGLYDRQGRPRPEFETLIPPKKRVQIAKLAQDRKVNESMSPASLSPQGELVITQDNLPVDISHLLSAYFIGHMKRKTIDAPQFALLTNTTNSMVDALTSLDRILTTPIPRAYNIHLKQVIYMYLFLLPFQVINDFKSYAILICFLVSFTFIGVESIGAEIENPFGTDDNDLPLELYILDLKEELYQLMEKPRVELADWELVAVGQVGPDSPLPASGH